MIRKTKDGFHLVSNVLVEIRDRKKRLVDVRKVHNKIPLHGRELVRDLIGGLRRWPTHMAVGTSSTAPADGDTALGAEVYRALITHRVQLAEGIKFQLYIPTTEANGSTLAECGLFTVVGDIVNKLFARAIFTATPKTSAVTVTISWTISITST